MRHCVRCGSGYEEGTYSAHRQRHPGATTERQRQAFAPRRHEADVLASVARGERGAEIGKRLRISRERVRQIYTRATGVGLPDYGTRCRICGDRWFGTEAQHRGSAVHRTALEARRTARFWRHVDRSDEFGCWPWLASMYPTGYGHSQAFGQQYSHRAAYVLVRGPIPKGLTLDHLCRNRACVNPAHLEAVTHRENVLRSPIAQAAINARKTHCKWGHPFDELNTVVTNAGHGRICRECRNAHSRKRAARRTAAQVGIAA